jgi:hypothetical protein
MLPTFLERALLLPNDALNQTQTTFDPIWPLTQHCWVYSSVDSFILFVLWNTFKFMIIHAYVNAEMSCLRKYQLTQALPYWPGVHVFWTHVTFMSSWLLLEVTRILTSSFLQSFNPSLLSEFRLSRMEYDSYTLTSSLPVPFLNNHVIGSWFQMKSPESYDTSVCGAPIREWNLLTKNVAWSDDPLMTPFSYSTCFAFITRSSNCKMSHFRFKS